MRVSGVRAFSAAILIVCLAAADAKAQLTAQSEEGWIVRAERLAQFVYDNNLTLTDAVRARREQEIARMGGARKLQGLYDIAVKAMIDGDEERSAASLAALEAEARAQRSDRFLAMAGMIRAFGPARASDIMGARRNLEQALQGVTDPYVLAAGTRLHAYVLTDLGLFGNALEVARNGLVHLPDDESTYSLRSGLHNAMSYNTSRVGDHEAALYHLQRNVELANADGNPIDGLMVINNAAVMLGQAREYDAALRLVDIHTRLADRSGASVPRFQSNLLCARINLLAGNAGPALQCANRGLALRGQIPSQFMQRMLVNRLHALARLRQGAAARQAMTQLRQLAAERSDPGLVERLDAIEPEVLRAEGRYLEAFEAMLLVHETAQRLTLTRFNDGVKELRATMESEVAQAEADAAAATMRSELQSRILEMMTLAIVLAGAFLIAAVIIVGLIHRSRRNMQKLIGRAEEVLARRGGQEDEIQTPAQTRDYTRRLANILDEIERRDVELERAFDELNTARIAAESANLAKSQFLATMSHELRTPLNAIIGYSELLAEIALEEEAAADQVGDLSRIRSAADRLLRLINDVLDLSKIEAGHMNVSGQAFEVEQVLEETLATLRPLAAANSNAIVVERADNLGAAHTDNFKLGQCLLNLVSNAAKFTREGTITLRAERECCEGADWLVFQVADTGIGISADAQKRLFQPFTQADATMTRAYGGTGLGLAITRRLARMMGGDVEMHSAEGEGSTFTLRVPARLPDIVEHNRPVAAAA
jgi:signal transduction histidine kinase